MALNRLCVGLFIISLGLPEAAWAQTISAQTPQHLVTENHCTKNSDCASSGVCGSDGICGRANGQACIASSQCRNVCAPDGHCGLLPAHSCADDASCRAEVCNADRACGFLMGAKCSQADTCRSGVCQNTTCVPFCAADADCQPDRTFCDTQGTHLCVTLVQDGAACSRSSMCQAGVCGTDGLCAAAAGQSCTTSEACRSGACQNGACSPTCIGDANCEVGTYCNAADNLCVQVQLADQSCERSAQCDGGVCESDRLCGALAGGNCTTPHTCRSLTCSAEGVCSDHCTSDTDCDFAHFCAGAQNSAVCTPLKRVGAACTQSNQCINGLCNTRGVCGQVNGGACAQGSDCTNGACEPEDLRCGLAAGTHCVDSTVCRVGYCNPADVCAPCTQNADCPRGLCDVESGACSNDPNYLGVGLEGGGCAQTGRTGLGALLGALALWMGLRTSKRRRPPALWVVLIGLGLCLPAQAAGFALQRFVPTDPGQTLMRVDRPWYATEGHTRLDVGLALDLGHNPLVYKTLAVGAPDVSTAIVAAQFNAVLQAAVSWTSWLTVSAHLPFVLVEAGHLAYGQGPKSPAVGTAQLNASLRLLGQVDSSAVSLHLAASLRFAQGSASHAHDSVFGVLPRVIVAGRPSPHVGYAANAGVLIRPSRALVAEPGFVAGNRQASELQLGLALSYIDDRFHWSAGPELNFATLLNRGGGGGGANSSLEMLLGAQQSVTSQVSAGLAVGVGLFGLAGTPDWRIMGRLSFSPFGTFAGTTKAALDADGDGIADEDDACPDTPGEPNSDSRAHGCPADIDGDGVIDADDLCPTVAAGLHPDKDRPGCPMPQHAVRPKTDSREADGQDGEATAQNTQPSPGAYTPRSAPPFEGGDDDFAPSDTQRGAAPSAEPDAATNTAAVQIPTAQSDMPSTESSPSQLANSHAAANPPTELSAEPLPQQPERPLAVALNEQSRAPVVRHNHRLQLKESITFVARTAKLSPSGRKAVQSLAQYLLTHGAFKQIGIDVYADNDGRVKTNRSIARARANAIKQLLIAQHIPAKKMRARGLASGRQTAADRTKQTRIELTVN